MQETQEELTFIQMLIPKDFGILNITSHLERQKRMPFAPQETATAHLSTFSGYMADREPIWDL